ncbi:hypothetical protein GBAR_LOCUS8439, partial [Geodia barretti]
NRTLLIQLISYNCEYTAKRWCLKNLCQYTVSTDKEKEQRNLAALNNAHRKLKNEISDLSDRLKMSRESIQRLKEQVEQAEEEELVGT